VSVVLHYTEGMKVVVAPDSFKGTLSASRVAGVIAEEVKANLPRAKVVTLPLADGGEGSTEALAGALSTPEEVDHYGISVQGPAGDEIIAYSSIISPGIAILEVAQSSGITRQDALHPMSSSTYGFGQLIETALGWGARDFILCLGGSATTDAGCGMAEALGVRFLDLNGEPIAPRGETLTQIASIDLSELDPRITESTFVALCDVDNPLFGACGAAFVFGPQKGATPQQILVLDEGLRHIAARIRKVAPHADPHAPGAGAAGGLGFGAAAFLAAELVSGSDYILDAVDFETHLAGTDLIITGEGRLDEQSFAGKVLSGILRRSDGVPVVSICGSCDCGEDLLAAHAVCAYPLTAHATREQCLTHPEPPLRKAVQSALRES